MNETQPVKHLEVPDHVYSNLVENLQSWRLIVSTLKKLKSIQPKVFKNAYPLLNDHNLGNVLKIVL